MPRKYRIKDENTGEVLKIRTDRYGNPIVVKRKGKGVKQKIKSKKGYTKFKTSKKGHKTVVGHHFKESGLDELGLGRRAKPSKKGKTRNPLSTDNIRWSPGKGLGYKVNESSQIEFEGKKKAKGGIVRGGRDMFTQQYD